MICERHKEKFKFKKSKKVYVEIYEYNLIFVETNNFNLAAERLGLKGLRNHDSAGALTWVADSGSQGYIFCEKNAPLHFIAHECWHILYHLFKSRGLEFEDETVAYHLDYLVKKAVQFYKCKR